MDGSVETSEGAVAYRDLGGQGPPVLLLHGLGGNLAHWELVARLVADRYRLVAVDLLSHGASSSPAAYSYAADLRAVDEVRQALQLERPAVVGHSYGGMLAVSLGARRPTDYRVVVNIDGLGFSLDPEPGAEPATSPPLVVTTEDQGDERWLDVQVDREVEEAAALGMHLHRDGEMVRRAFQRRDDGLWHSSPTLGRFTEIERALQGLRLLHDYRASSCRTVTVIADHRHAADREELARARRHVEDVRAALLACGTELERVTSGHHPHVEAPEVIAHRFEDWVGPG